MIGAPRQAVILAGGLGTRLRPLTDTLPKPLIAFRGRPFLEHLVEMLRRAGITRVLLLVGYRAEQIMGYFGDGSRFGVEIAYRVGAISDETGSRLRDARPDIDSRFLLMYCDNYWPLDPSALTAEFIRGGRRGLVTVYANDDGWTRDNVRVDADGRIVCYDKSRRADDLSGVDIGYAIFERDVLDLMPPGNVSFEATVYPQLVAAGELGAFVTSHRYYSVGSLERLPETARFFERPKTILLDRDGTLNERMPPGEYVTSTSTFAWEAGALEGLRALAEAGYRVAVITNQPGIARGTMSNHDVDAIHAHMVREARAAGGDIGAFFVCPHGWNEGCDCRKPRPGLLHAAQRKLCIDLSQTWFIGDDERDGAAAAAAGAPFIKVGAGTTILEAINAVIRRKPACLSYVNAY